MEDAVSRSSFDSSSIGEDFVVVNGEPKLKITGDINDISEEITESNMDQGASSREVMSQSMTSISHVMPTSQSVDILSTERLSTSYIEGAPYEITDENADDPARGKSSSLPSTPSGQYVAFHGVTYLGCAMVNAPRSEVEIYRNMAILNENTQCAIPIILSVPSTSEGVVSNNEESIRLLDPSSSTEMTSYRIHRILFCARGPTDSNEKQCFAFTCGHGDTAENAIFQCHVFRCDIPEAVPKILYCFGTTFRRVPRAVRTSSSSGVADPEQDFIFSVGVEFKEDDGKGSFSTCPMQKSVFKFRCNTEKRIHITVQKTGPRELEIERCFGLLISPGRNVKHSDMQLIEMVSMGLVGDTTYAIAGNWDPTEKCFQVLNTETPKDTRVFLTVAVDLVLEGIQEPVRFTIETKAKIYPQSERFWQFTKKLHYEQFHMKIKQLLEEKNGTLCYEVMNVESQTEIDRKKAAMSLTLTPNKQIPENIQTPQDGDDESDGDEPLLSGSGCVSKEVTDDNLLEAWSEVLTKWQQNLSQKPKQVTQLVRKGIPEALRGEVWQLLSGCHEKPDLLEAFRVLITQESPNEQVIQRDINRTFPAHDYFKESGGVGQDALYKISKLTIEDGLKTVFAIFPVCHHMVNKYGVSNSLADSDGFFLTCMGEGIGTATAYSVYDDEIGYCQGLSFLAAALLLHMPEEQAFCVLVKIMSDYELRDLFKQGFEELHLKFYQLERLMQDQMPDLYNHFMEMGLETHMFASQWFLTLFTAKFPLFMVFQVLDLFLSEGKDVIFSVAAALLKSSRKDLLALDFEGVLKYFRVQLPKKYRTEDAAKQLILLAINTKVSGKKLKKYEKEYIAIKEQELQQEDPVDRFERENKRLAEANMRLEQENDDLAHEMVESKLKLRSELDAYQDQCESLSIDIEKTTQLLTETEEEKKRLEMESGQLKEMCRRELHRAEAENNRNNAIINDYKQICSQLSERLEKQQTATKEELQRIRKQVRTCDNCSQLFDEEGKVKIADSIVDPNDLNPKVIDLERHVRELELELAQTKLALVESECKTQDLTHQLNAALTEIQTSKNTWFQKTLTSIKEVTNPKKDPKE